LAEGVWVALAVLAVSGWRLAVVRGGIRRWASHLVVAGVFPSTAILLAGGILTASRVAEPVYRPGEEVQAFEYLAEEAEPGAVVLAAFETGNPMPAWAPVRVVVGHGPESVGLDELRPVVAAFYSGSTSDGDRTRLVRELEIAYIYWGPAERRLGSWEPADSTWLERVYHRGAVTIFEVLDPNS
jgi:hypothetical protein